MDVQVQLWEDVISSVENAEIEMRQGKGGGLTGGLRKRKDIRNPEALGAFLGRKKLGKSHFQNKAARARNGHAPRRAR